MNFYEVLGISKTASSDDIKKAYRKLARDKHPDKGGSNEEFQTIQQAYETLSDPSKKREYDSPNNTNHFSFAFNKKHIHKCQNHNYTCNIKLKDVYTGLNKKFKIKKDKIFVLCNKDFDSCNGEGIARTHIQNGPFIHVIQQICNKCKGKGKIKNNYVNKCTECNDNGFLTEERLIEIKIPRGIDSGYTTIFREWGEQPTKSDQVPGDLIVTVVIEEDHVFKRENLDLYFTSNISLKESLIGKEVIIEHFEGEIKLNIKCFGVINPNMQYTIFKKGLVKDNGDMGNLHIKFNIIYPEKVFNDVQHQQLSNILELIKL